MAAGFGTQTPHQDPGDSPGGEPIPSRQAGYPGCLTLVVSGVILFLISLIIVGSLWLAGVNLHRRFLLVFFIFAAAGAFMFQLAKRLDPYLRKSGKRRSY